LLNKYIKNRLKSAISFVALFAVFSTVTACGSKSESLDKRLTYATGVWTQFKDSFGQGSSNNGPFVSDGEIFGASFTPSSTPENFECWSVEDFMSGVLKIYKYSDETFLEAQSIDLLDTYVEDIQVGDIKNDGTQEIVLNASCYKGQGVKAFELEEGKWSPIPDLVGSVFQNGILMNVSPDCTPSCADGGTEYTKISWDGSTFVANEIVTSKGEPVNLSVSITCPTFRPVTTLPIKPCDEGVLVRQLIALAQNVGAYADGELSSLYDRYTPALAQWILTYQYRHEAPLSTSIGNEMYSLLGRHWYPDMSDPNKNSLFYSYCTSGDPYSCESHSFLWPTISCPEYFWAAQEFPVRRCETGAWVNMIASALKEFDGKELKDEFGVGLFDEELEARIRIFQKQRKLEVDGLVGANTWRALFGNVRDSYDDMNGDGMYGPGDIIPH
jgi:peptidoglycan hydrolase-like protein with peptidoglycan-binding domain